MSKLSEAGYAIREIPADHVGYRYKVVSPSVDSMGNDYDHSVYRLNGNFAVFKSYSGAYAYCKREGMF